LYILTTAAIGRLSDYDQLQMLELTKESQRKLMLLTLLSACKGKRVVEYAILMQELQLLSVRQVEDLIISAIEQDLLVGKLDQKSVCIINNANLIYFV
jgi:COP9 signalosome complex subunit 7